MTGEAAAPSRFTQRAQFGLIVLLVVALFGVGQPWSFRVYEFAIVAMVGLGLVQVAVGNIPSDASPSRFLRYLAIFGLVIVAVVALSIWIAPRLVELGR